MLVYWNLGGLGMEVKKSGGAEGVRTPYLFNAIESLSQTELQPHKIRHL